MEYSFQRENEVLDTMTRDVERELEELILARTKHMLWRPNWTGWVKARLWQERYREPVISNLKRYVPNWREALVLDLGCGMGGTVVRLLQEGVRAIGLDVCYEYCLISKIRGMRYKLSVPILCGVGEAIPLKDQSVDVILCQEVIEHVFEPLVFLREIRRIVRPKGLVFITAPNRWTLYDHHYHLWGIGYLPRHIADKLIEKLGRSKGEDVSAGVQKLSQMHYFSWRSFLNLCRTAGFQISDVREDKLAEYVTKRIGRTLSIILLSLGFLRLAYRIYRATIMDEWHVILTPRFAGR